MVAKSRSKYGNVRTESHGITFDSKAEAKRYRELKLLEEAKLIHTLELQPAFPLHAPSPAEPEPLLLGHYIADFSYFDLKVQAWIVEDVKGGKATQTPLFSWKWKHVQAQYPTFKFKIIGG